ncbi:pirin family protein [Nocardia farcinica]|uniref:pirin family protein n=1 Tax=Nocardia farcinica TaxID=37329 RepID=UPI00189409E1|nr:pirin family protein [Nocardia farcinica]MBF6264936.1 pirin family protein [Nocardia farcinica]MBF6283722.1 pirin family protein [Nocardia farcinica]MBF6307325.1 pirin family protein [Nocardia farcinica]MBF6362121.1 pirin family protein [Nocardia farcinica]MBF6392609.1 pirin family protein [Nocardia farcinica]
MSDLDPHPNEAVCAPAPGPGPVAELYPAREVPLGGVRGVYVERVLPQRDLPTVGAWCFLDHFGAPTVTKTDAPPDIDPHPHIGLQTVTWPFQGRIRHRDSVGSDVVINPGQLNLMTSGVGIAHSEYYDTEAPASHGLQLWIALPRESTGVAPHFEQHRDLPVYEAAGVRAVVLIGTLAGLTSPARAYTPIVGADMRVAAGAEVSIPVDPSFEHALLVIEGEVTVADTSLKPGPLLYLGTDRRELRLSSGPGAHVALIGGEPFGEELVMWWNFVGRTHEEIVAARTQWERHDVGRFPDIAGHRPEQRIPAPPLPPLHLKPRKRRLGAARE